MSLDSIVLEMVVEEFVDRLMAQMNAQVLALFLDAPGHQRLGDVLHRDRRRVHQRAQNQVAVAARFFVDRAKSVSILARKTRDRFAGLVEIGMHHQRGAVLKHARHLHRRLHVTKSMAAHQFEVVVNRADADQGVIIRVNVVQEARPRQFLGAECRRLLRCASRKRQRSIRLSPGSRRAPSRCDPHRL